MRRVQACLISIALLILSFDPSHASDSFAWETFNETLSKSGYESHLVTGSDGIPTALWIECTDNSCSQRSLFASRYESDRWSTPIMIASSDYITLPRLTPSINGDLLVVWVEQGSTIKSSWWRNGTWTPAATIAGYTSPILMESIVDSEGIATVAWASRSVEVARSQGEQWTPSQTLCKAESTESGYSWCGGLQLAVDSDNVVTAAWVVNKDGNRHNSISGSRFVNGGWGESMVIAEESSYYDYALFRIVSNKPGEVIAFWVLGTETQSSHYYNLEWHSAISVGPLSPCGYIYTETDKVKLLNIGKDTVMSAWGGAKCCYFCEIGPYLTATMVSGNWGTPVETPMRMIDLATDSLGHAMLLGIEGTAYWNENGWDQPVKFTGIQPDLAPIHLTMSPQGSATLLLNGNNWGLMAKRGIKNALTVNIQKKGLGTVVSQPQGMDCGNTCVGYFRSGTSMELHPLAPPESGYAFSGWEGDCSGTGVCSLIVDSNKSVTAKFTQLPRYRITVTRPTGGRVQGFPMNSSGSPGIAEISCPPACTGKYYKGQVVVFEAQAFDAYYLKGWHGCTVQPDNTCKVVLDRPNMHVKAIFKKKPKYALTLRKNTHGSVETNLPEGNCAAYKTKCVFKVPEGNEVLLIMRPKPGRTYLGWGGDCVDTNPECRLIMNQDKFVEAIFE